jgi:hypothetical protein
MAAEVQTAREAYIEGRLIGLAELVSILKETMESGETDVEAIIRSIVEHVNNEMSALLIEMAEAHGEKHPLILSAQSRSNAMAKDAAKGPQEEALKRQVASADVLLKNLMALQRSQGEGAQGESAKN